MTRHWGIVVKRNWLLWAALLLGVSGFAGFSPAMAYPDVECHITDPGRACEGEPLSLTATVDPAVDCTTISITWNGITRSGTGSTLSATFPTHKGDADRPALRRDSVSCTYMDTAQNGTQSPRTVSAVGTVVITDCDDVRNNRDNDNDDSDDSDDSDEDDDNGGLPNTGGERMIWLLVGLVLIAGGAATVASARGDGSHG
jgi:hypothetical protein